MSTETNETKRGLRVVKLEAENYKRLSAVEIIPDLDAATVTIAGRNAQGKSSVLDAIWAALSNTAASKGTTTTRPIRDGEKSARVSVDLGDIIVTRKWEGDKNTLVVESVDGARFPSPQRMLDELIGHFSFDPLAFASLPAKSQQAELLHLVDLPFEPEALAGQRKAAFDDRTIVGRAVKQLQGQLAGFPEIGDDVPDELVSVAALVAELDDAGKQQLMVAAHKDEVSGASADIDRTKREIEKLSDELARWRERLAEHEEHHRVALADLASLPEPPDIEPIRTLISGAETINAAVRQKHQRQEVIDLIADEKATYEALTARIAELDKTKSDGLAAAVFPIDGLGFDDDGVTYNGVPFAQASSAERLRVSVAMAMALNPQVRVIRISDGSLLDSENLAVIESMASEQGFQVWIEVVDETGTIGVVIEDGQVKA